MRVFARRASRPWHGGAARPSAHGTRFPHLPADRLAAISSVELDREPVGVMQRKASGSGSVVPGFFGEPTTSSNSLEPDASAVGTPSPATAIRLIRLKSATVRYDGTHRVAHRGHQGRQRSQLPMPSSLAERSPDAAAGAAHNRDRRCWLTLSPIRTALRRWTDDAVPHVVFAAADVVGTRATLATGIDDRGLEQVGLADVVHVLQSTSGDPPTPMPVSMFWCAASGGSGSPPLRSSALVLHEQFQVPDPR